ncbi:MAG TPA: hypothetical protein VLV46_06305 [Gaiellaceae bacterium]|nr:hypothetical protein [Gaiellaceae bacterium]
MDKFNELSLGEKLVLGAGVLLFIDLFLHWQSYDLGPITLGRSGIHGFWGIFLFLFTIAIVAVVGAKLFAVKLPDGLPEGLITVVLGGLIVFFAVIKNISDDYSAWPSYVGIVLAALVAYGGWLVFKDSGESLPMSSSSGDAGSAPAAAPPPTTPPPTTPPPSDPPREPDAS